MFEGSDVFGSTGPGGHATGRGRHKLKRNPDISEALARTEALARCVYQSYLGPYLRRKTIGSVHRGCSRRTALFT